MSDQMGNEIKHEPDTTSVPLMTSAGLGLLFLVLGAVVVAALVFRFVLPDRNLISAEKKAGEQSLTPGVQPNQAYERQQTQIEQRRVLSEFYWQNKEQGLASIPIEQAITIMAQRKLRTNWPVVDPTADLPAETATATETAPVETQPEVAQPKAAQPRKTPSNDAPSNDAPSNDAPSMETPSNDAPSMETPSNDAPSPGAPSPEAPPKGAPPINTQPKEQP